MESFKPVALLLLCLLSVTTTVTGWGVDGHFATCKIAQGRLSQAAADAVNHLLPEYAEGDLATLCSWADHVKFRYHWSSPLHYIDTPDNLCTYQYNRDCKDEDGVMGRCVAGAINNYTTQLLDYGKQTSQYNLTEALLFLSHFIGDIHQPLHVGFTTDRGGNTIDVHWFTRKAVLHHVWDDSIIETAEERFYNSDVETLIDAIQINITNEWADQVQIWERCSRSQTTCPNIYATEGIKAACNWAYKGVGNDSVLGDEYFLSRLPIVNWRLAQGGVRLAATLNRIFG
ncbi:endonuclease 2 isoform X2 [Cynara cardunculus var. scolymus]|uniref:endonuclease 2 isoform X2 n=1 Tax=Cynara cardunculus var. scolymus TaxID=59895 RepID=UPI000D62A45E|nr:endonuclease 2 isoform X2 [Cynara cardunculus var. scolymus]